jgi:tight adherence protein B
MMDLGFGVFVLVLFIGVVFLLEGAYVLWNDHKGPEAQRLERRLRSLSAGRHGSDAVQLLKARNLSEVPWLSKLLLSTPRAALLDRWLQQSGQRMSVGRFLFISLLCGTAPLLALLVLRVPFPLALACGALGSSLPAVFVAHLRSKRLHKFEEQLPDALDLISRALRAGHAFPSAMQMVATEAADPVATEFQITFDEINYGVSVHDAMLNLATRVPSMDLRYFIISVLLQRETGGNLSELLGNLSHLIRERFKLLGRIRVLAAEGKLSAYILIGLPFATAAMIYLVNPKFLSVLWTDPAGLRLLAGASLMMVFGSFVMWRIVKIRV